MLAAPKTKHTNMIRHSVRFLIQHCAQAVVITLVIGLHGRAWAFAMPEPMPLPQTIAEATTIVVARVRKYTPDPEVPPKPTVFMPVGSKKIPVYMGPDALIGMTKIKPSGAYALEVLQTIKGACPVTVTLKLPYILSISYNDVRLRVTEGSRILLLLRQNVKGQWAAVDSALPLIQLSDADPKSTIPPNAAPQDSVISLILASLADPTLRVANIKLLRPFVGAQVVAGLATYLDDPNPKVRDEVFFCMAANQQVMVIPRIDQLAANALRQPMGQGSVQSEMAVEKFNTPEAIPYLNPLLLHGDQYIRLNAMFALGRLANRSTIPYLLLALRDPEWQKVTAYSAYGLLCRLTHTAVTWHSEQAFYAHRSEAISLFNSWWRDELASKHLPKAGETRPVAMPMLDATVLQKPEAVTLLNPLLLETALTTRQQAMAALIQRADHSSIPYLLLALQDPDSGIAYSAYATLYRLLPDLGQPKSQDEFTTHLETVTQPLYAWWQAELLGQHLPSPVALKGTAQAAKP